MAALVAACNAPDEATRAPGPATADAAASADTALVIEHVTVLPMTVDGGSLSDATVVVRNGRIESITSSREHEPPSDVARVVDGTGKWLMPALADMHVHVEYHESEAELADLLLPYVANGVLQIMNMAAVPRALEQRDAVESGRVLGPHMALAVLVDGSPPIWPREISRVAATPEEGRRIVRDIKAEGFDFVKTYSRLTPETFTAIVDEARKQGLRVVGHIPARGEGNTEKFLLPGYAMVAHAEEFAYRSRKIPEAEIPRFAQLARQNGTWLISTLHLNETIVEQMRDLEKVMSRPELAYVHPATLEGWIGANPYVKGVSPERVARVSQVVEFNRKLVRAFVEAGVPVVAGTDASVPGVIPGFSLHEELRALAAAGLSNEQVLASATRLPAEWLGVSDDRGTVEAGKRANLLLLDADPMQDVANTRRIAAVIANGRYLSSDDLRAMLDATAARYAAAR